jgi:hypothetical protein
MNMNRNRLRSLIKESIQEVIGNPAPQSPADAQRDKLKSIIKKMIRESVEAGEIKKDKKTKDDSFDPQDVKDRVAIEKDRPEGKSFEEILKKLESVAKAIDPKVIVTFDDHKDFNVEVPQAFRVRISPRWENNFDVEAFVESNDRIKVIGLTLDQVVDFLKQNFTEKVKDNVQKSVDKVDANRKDQVKEPSPGIDSSKGIKQFKPEKKTKDAVEKDEDLPGAPMAEVEVDKLKHQRDYKESQVKPPKHKNDDKLVVKMPGKKK